ELAEYVPRPKRREGDRAAIRMLPRHSQIAAADDVAGVGGVALPQDPHALRKRPRHGHARDGVQLLRRELVEERHAREQGCDLSPRGPHAVNYARLLDRRPGSAGTSTRLG